MIAALVMLIKDRGENMLKKVGDGITKLNKTVFSCASFVIYPLIFVVVFEVIMRYIFKSPTGWAYDMTWMLFGAFTFLGGAHALAEGAHVKADIILELVPKKVKSIIIIICYIVFFFPLIFAFLYSSTSYVSRSISMNEKSPYTGWAPIIWPSKIIMYISFILLLLQGIVEFCKALKGAFGKEETAA